MKLRVHCLDLDAGGKTIAIINSEDARELGVHPLDRIILMKGKKKISAVVNVSDRFVLSGNIAVYNEIKDELRLKDEDYINVVQRPELESKQYIRKKIEGTELTYKEIKTIVDDVNARNLNDLEQASLITALHINKLTLNENISFAKAMIESGGELLHFPGTVVDKHSSGGIPGDKTTMLLVPIIAAAGLTIPKTSSRAITDPAGTADRVEVLCPVNLEPRKIVEVVRKTNGCMIWGGALKLAPADDLLIQIERPLGLDPLIIPSVLAKKKVVGSRYVIIDLATGPEAKMKTREEAEKMAATFILVGKKLGMEVECAITRADQPIGYAMGPALEAREALEALMNSKQAPKDLIDKAISLAGILFEMVGKGDKHLAEKILFSGKAEKKFREIISAQGGRGKIRPRHIPVEKKTKRISIKADKSGTVSYISNKTLVHIAKIAGAPKDKFSGILLNKKLNEHVAKGEILYTIYAEKPAKLKQALIFAKANRAYSILAKERRMIVEEINHGVKRYE